MCFLEQSEVLLRLYTDIQQIEYIKEKRFIYFIVHFLYIYVKNSLFHHLCDVALV